MLHFHTENSRFDSIAKMDDMCRRAKELGYTTLGLTEHGVMTSVYAFLESCKKYGLKAIPGVETYVGDKRAHMCLFPVSEQGYKAIIKLVSESFHHVDAYDTPISSWDMLKKYFGEGSLGHGEVIASSACVGGVICKTLNANEAVDKKIKHIMGLREKYEKAHPIPEDVDFEEILFQISELEQQIQFLRADISVHKKNKDKKMNKEKKVFETFSENDDGYEEAKKAYEAKKFLIENAKEQYEIKKKEKERLDEILRNKKKSIKKYDAVFNKINEYDTQIESLEAEKMSEYEAYHHAKDCLLQLKQIFGEDNFYGELQYHGWQNEKILMPKALDLFTETKTPIIITNDAHMVSNTEIECKGREYIRAMRYNKFTPYSKEDKELYIKSEKELVNFLRQLFPEEILSVAVENCNKIGERCNVSLNNSDHYPVYDKDLDAGECLRAMCQKGKKKVSDWNSVYEERLQYELDVIIKMGYADYHLITADYLQYGKLIGKIDFSKYEEEYKKAPYDIKYLEKLVENTNGVGEGIGPGRGSAAGSLVCYLIDITDVDPIKYNLLFERFLNVERVSMPDIDSDFSPEIREKVIDYVRYKYGDEAVCMIVTFGLLGAKKSIRNVARIYGLEKKNDNMAFSALADKICKDLPNELNISLSNLLDDEIVCDENGVESINHGLKYKYRENKDAIAILTMAEFIEGTFIDYGMHAAGVVIADCHPVSDYIPLMCNDGKNIVSQFSKELVEECGLLKMDFLGLKNLGIITQTLRSIQKNVGKSIDMSKIDFDDQNVINQYASGYTNGIFQVESPGMKSVNKDFKPSSFEDIILIIAAYRPGPMQFIPEIIAVKNGEKEPSYPISEMGDVLDVTYGFPVYQEQIMEIFHRFAGFSLGKADIVRRYMSKKKVEKFLEFKDDFINGLTERGSDKKKAEDYWENLVDFSKYAFNKSHATAYAIVSYQTAWLKYYYPREYTGAYLDCLNTKELSGKIRNLRNDLKMVNYDILKPDINHSDVTFCVEGENVRYSFYGIRGLSEKTDLTPIIEERRLNGPFKDFRDFIKRTILTKKVLKPLIHSGCLDSIYPQRSNLLSDDVIEELIDINKNIQKNEQKGLSQFDAYHIPVNKLSEEEILNDEKYYLGDYFSKNPLDSLPSPADVMCTPIEYLDKGKGQKICGIISDLKIVGRKSDGEKLAFFTCEDKSGSVDVCCFCKEYQKFGKDLKDGAKIKIIGNVNKVTDNYGDEEEEKLQFVMKNLYKLNEKKEDIIIPIKNIIEWQTNTLHRIRPYLCEDGNPLVLYDKTTKQFRLTTLMVSDDLPKNFSA